MIYAHALNAQFFHLSAVSAGKDDIRKIIAADAGGKPKLLFLDEIHRFNKAQQDFLLPYVERGEVTLVGATTENPSFEVIPALLSRCRVFILNELTPEDIKKITARAAAALGVSVDAKSDEFLVNVANGDGRQVVTILENTVRLYGNVTVDTLTKTLQSKNFRYDRAGEEHYNTISAFIKSSARATPMPRCTTWRAWLRLAKIQSSLRGAWLCLRQKTLALPSRPRSWSPTRSSRRAKPLATQSAL